jgi:cobalt-precorrin-6B (C15)-methyltransferase
MKRVRAAIPDEEFQRGEVPMTKAEIRVFVMAHAGIQPTDVVWDVGAGTGSLSVESALRAPEGRIYAMDGNAEACELVRVNARNFNVPNIIVINAKAPKALAEIPDPDVVFVGGSGGNLELILTVATQRLRTGGRLIVTAVLVETLAETLRFLETLPNFRIEACGLQITKVQPVAKRHMFRALNPIYIVIGHKGGDE